MPSGSRSKEEEEGPVLPTRPPPTRGIPVGARGDQLLLERPTAVAPTLGTASRSEELSAAAVKEQLADMAAKVNALVDGLASIQDTTQRIETGQETQLSMTSQVIARTKELKQYAVETAGLVKENLNITKGVSQKLDRFRTAGFRAGLSSILYDEFAVLFVYMILHPYFTYTMENFISLWSLVLIARRIPHIPRNVATALASVASIDLKGVVQNYVFNPTHAAFLLFYLNSRFISLAATDPTEHQTYFPGTGEQVVMSFLNSASHMVVPGNYTIGDAKPEALEQLREPFLAFWREATELRGIVERACPAIGKDPRFFVNCVLENAAEKLSVATAAGVEALIPSGLLYQGTQLVRSETQFLWLIATFSWKLVNMACGKTFQSLTATVQSTYESVTGLATKATSLLSWAVPSKPTSWKFWGGTRGRTRSVRGRRRTGTRKAGRLDPALLAIYTRAHCSAAYMVSNMLGSVTDGALVVPDDILELLGLYAGLSVEITTMERLMGKWTLPQPRTARAEPWKQVLFALNNAPSKKRSKRSASRSSKRV